MKRPHRVARRAIYQPTATWDDLRAPALRPAPSPTTRLALD